MSGTDYDNHHNAVTCPYCNPEHERLQAELQRLTSERDELEG